MDARAKMTFERAEAVLREYGLEALDVDESKAIPAAVWRTWGQAEPTRRLVTFIAEGLVSSIEAAEVASVKRRNIKGLRRGTGLSNDLAKEEVLARTKVQLYGELLRGIAIEANKL